MAVVATVTFRSLLYPYNKINSSISGTTKQQNTRVVDDYIVAEVLDEEVWRRNMSVGATLCLHHQLTLARAPEGQESRTDMYGDDFSEPPNTTSNIPVGGRLSHFMSE